MQIQIMQIPHKCQYVDIEGSRVYFCRKLTTKEGNYCCVLKNTESMILKISTLLAQ